MNGRTQGRGRSSLWRAAGAVFLLITMGCSSFEFAYREEEVIPPPQAGIETKSFAEAIPFLADLFRIFEATPKAAIYEGMGYKRSMGLIRWKGGEGKEELR